MSTVTITCVGDGTFGTKTEQYNFSDAGLNRMITWAQANYLNPDGSQPGPNAANNRLWQAIIQGVKDNVRNHERVVAINAISVPVVN